VNGSWERFDGGAAAASRPPACATASRTARRLRSRFEPLTQRMLTRAAMR
jgi:hypothetical protein